MRKLTYTSPEMTVTELSSEDIVLISIDDGGPGDLPTIPWTGTTDTEEEW